MKKSFVVLLAVIPSLALTTACHSVLPSEATTAKAQWKSFEEVRTSFEQLVPNQTSLADMKRLGYDPDRTPNLKTLTYVDVMNRFLPNSSIRVENLHEAIQACLREKDACRAYELDLNQIKGDRYGNVCADIFGFRKRTKITGWSFKGLVITKGDKVIYTLWSGEPSIDRTEQKRKPLGPLQDLEGLVYRAAGSAF